MRKGCLGNISCTIPERESVYPLVHTRHNAPPFAKVTKSRHDKSSLVETVVDPSSYLKGIA